MKKKISKSLFYGLIKTMPNVYCLSATHFYFIAPSSHKFCFGFTILLEISTLHASTDFGKCVYFFQQISNRKVGLNFRKYWLNCARCVVKPIDLNVNNTRVQCGIQELSYFMCFFIFLPVAYLFFSKCKIFYFFDFKIELQLVT